MTLSRPRPEDLLLLEWIFGGEPPTARHAFVLLSTNPARALGPALDLAIVCGVPVVPQPFDVDDLLDAVASAARRIAGGVLFDEVPASTRHTDPPLGDDCRIADFGRVSRQRIAGVRYAANPAEWGAVVTWWPYR